MFKIYLNGSASGKREFVMIFGASFADKRASASAVEIRVYNAVKRLGKFQVDFHGSRSAAQTGRWPAERKKQKCFGIENNCSSFQSIYYYYDWLVGADDVGEIVQLRDDAIESGFLRNSIALILNVDSALRIIWLGRGTDDPILERDGEYHAPHSYKTHRDDRHTEIKERKKKNMKQISIKAFLLCAPVTFGHLAGTWEPFFNVCSQVGGSVTHYQPAQPSWTLSFSR